MSHVSHVTHVNIQTFSSLNSLDTTHDQSQPSTLWREVPVSHAGPTNVKFAFRMRCRYLVKYIMFLLASLHQKGIKIKQAWHLEFSICLLGLPLTFHESLMFVVAMLSDIGIWVLYKFGVSSTWDWLWVCGCLGLGFACCSWGHHWPWVKVWFS